MSEEFGSNGLFIKISSSKSLGGLGGHAELGDRRERPVEGRDSFTERGRSGTISSAELISFDDTTLDSIKFESFGFALETSKFD